METVSGAAVRVAVGVARTGVAVGGADVAVLVGVGSASVAVGVASALVAVGVGVRVEVGAVTRWITNERTVDHAPFVPPAVRPRTRHQNVRSLVSV